MNLYAESSAVLAWLLGEAEGDEVRPHLGRAKSVVSSELTLVECDRALQRAVVLSDIPEADAAELRVVLATTARAWYLQRLTAEVIERARRRFPVEPVRTLDALHLASALEAAGGLESLAVLTLDERVRRNAAALGLGVLPRGR